MHNLLKYLTDAVGWKWRTWNLVTFNLPSTLSLSWQKRPQILFGRVSKRTVVIELNPLDNLAPSYHSVLLVEIASFLGNFFYLTLRPIYMIITTWSLQLDIPFLYLTYDLLIYYCWCFLHWFDISNVPQKIVFL